MELDDDDDERGSLFFLFFSLDLPLTTHIHNYLHYLLSWLSGNRGEVFFSCEVEVMCTYILYSTH